MNCKLYMILIIVIIFDTSLIAQVRFSKSYDLAEYSDLGLEILKLENQVIIASRGFCNYPISTDCAGLIAINLEGDELWKTSFDSLSYFYKNNVRIIDDTIYSLVVGIREFEITYRILTHDLSGNLLDNRLVNFSRPVFKVPYFNKTEDGWLLNVSERINGKWQNYLVWLNEFLEPTNIKNYTDVNYSFQSFEMLELSNGGFLIAGSYQTVNWAQEHGLILLDSLGNVVWDRRLPPPYSNGIGGLIEAGDGNFIVTYPTEDFNTDDDYYPPTIQKVDSEGNVLWRHIFYSMWPKGNGEIKLMENGDIVGTGDQLDAAGTDLAGWIFRINQDGEIIWDRAIAENRYGGLQSSIYDIVELSNGDLMFCGLLQDTVLNPNIPEAQINTWLVRTGPDGCLISDPEFCNEVAYVTSTEELATVIEYYTIFPNPVGNQLYIDRQEDRIGSVELQIYTINGQLIKQVTQINNFPHQLSVEGLNPGFYLIKIIDDKGNISTSKMVKQ